MSMGSHFHKFLAIDCETSGMNFGDDPSDGYQMVSVALIVSDVNTYTEHDHLYLKIRWNGDSGWDKKAEEVHGLSVYHLEEYGVEEDDACADIIEFIMKHFDINKSIVLCGHNVVRFDLPFLRRLLNKFGVTLKFSHRAIDSFPIGLLSVGAFDSDELFDYMGLPPRKEHNALEDIRHTLSSLRKLNKLFKACLNE